MTSTVISIRRCTRAALSLGTWMPLGTRLVVLSVAAVGSVAVTQPAGTPMSPAAQGGVAAAAPVTNLTVSTAVVPMAEVQPLASTGGRGLASSAGGEDTDSCSDPMTCGEAGMPLSTHANVDHQGPSTWVPEHADKPSHSSGGGLWGFLSDLLDWSDKEASTTEPAETPDMRKDKIAGQAGQAPGDGKAGSNSTISGGSNGSSSAVSGESTSTVSGDSAIKSKADFAAYLIAKIIEYFFGWLWPSNDQPPTTKPGQTTDPANVVGRTGQTPSDQGASAPAATVPAATAPAATVPAGAGSSSAPASTAPAGSRNTVPAESTNTVPAQSADTVQGSSGAFKSKADFWAYMIAKIIENLYEESSSGTSTGSSTDGSGQTVTVPAGQQGANEAPGQQGGTGNAVAVRPAK